MRIVFNSVNKMAPDRYCRKGTVSLADNCVQSWCLPSAPRPVTVGLEFVCSVPLSSDKSAGFPSCLELNVKGKTGLFQGCYSKESGVISYGCTKPLGRNHILGLAQHWKQHDMFVTFTDLSDCFSA